MRDYACTACTSIKYNELDVDNKAFATTTKSFNKEFVITMDCYYIFLINADYIIQNFKLALM